MEQIERLTLDVAGVVMAVDLPAGWLPPLAARYAEFASDALPAWHVTLQHDPTLDDEPAGWIEHTEQLTRFRVHANAGWLNLDEHRAAISSPTQARAFSAVERILVYICMQTLPREHAGLLLHASGVMRHGGGHVFVGPSGAGKTTVARLAEGYGRVLCDENVILRTGDAGPELWSTPFWGFSTPPEMIVRARLHVPLRAVYILAQTPGFELTRLAPGQAALALLGSEKVAVERPASANAWLAAAERLVSQVPVYRLGFRPTVELWSFLDETVPV